MHNINNTSVNSIYEPVTEIKIKSNLECHPFGGVMAIKDYTSDKI